MADFVNESRNSVFCKLFIGDSVSLDKALENMNSCEKTSVLGTAHIATLGSVTPLIVAVQNEDLDSVKVLLKHNANIEGRGHYNYGERTHLYCTPLCCAAADGNVDILSCLMENGADTNACEGNRCTPLMMASARGHVNAVTVLTDRGADVTLKSKDGKTALHHAVHDGYVSLVEVLSCLIKNGAEVNARDQSGRTPLMEACRRCRANVVTFLIEHGAEVNARDQSGRTPLMEACKHCRANVVTFLIEHGAEVNARDQSGHTPLMEACSHGEENAVTFLIEHGADVDPQDNDEETALHHAVYSDCESLEILSCLILKGLDVNACESDGRSPLMIASVRGKVNSVAFLLEHGANVNLQNKNGKTALHYAVIGYNGSCEVFRCLIENGADVNACLTNDKCTPLMQACDYGQVYTATCLIDYGAALDLQDKNGDTALHYAVRFLYTDRSIRIVQKLLTSGVSFLFNNHGVKPLILASSYSNRPAVEYLITRPEITRKERIDAIELLGASLATYRLNTRSSTLPYILEDTSNGFNYIKRGMEERFANPSQPLLKQEMETVEAYQNRKECQTLEELAEIEGDRNAIIMESLVIRERILGKENAELLATNIRCVAEYFNTHDLSLSIALYRHITTEIASNCSHSFARDLSTLTSLYQKSWKNGHPKEKHVIELLEHLIFEFEKHQTLPVNDYLEELLGSYERQLSDLFYCSVKIVSFIPKLKFRQEGKTSYALVLLKKLSQINPQCFGNTLLHAVIRGHIVKDSSTCLDAVKLLLNAGFNVNAFNKRGCTPLHLAVSLKPENEKIHLLTNLLKVLLDGGAHHDFVNSKGKTPMDIARTDEARMILSEKRKLELKCISAKAVKKFGIPYLGVVPKTLEKYISAH